VRSRSLIAAPAAALLVSPPRGEESDPGGGDHPGHRDDDQRAAAHHEAAHAEDHRRPPSLDRLAREEPPQVVGQLARSRVPPRRVLLERLQADDLQFDRSLRSELSRRLGLHVNRPIQSLQGRVPDMRRPAGDRLVQRRAESVDVAPRVHALEISASELRRHVARRSHDLARDGHPRLPGLRGTLDPAQAEIGQERVSLRGDQDVRGLHVAVQHSAIVGVGQRLRRLADDAGRLPRFRPPRRHPAIERLPRRQRHRVVVGVALAAEIEDRHDARVREEGEELRFPKKPRLQLGVAEAQPLERQLPVQERIPGPKYHAGASPAQLFEQDIAADRVEFRDFLFRRAPFQVRVLDQPFRDEFVGIHVRSARSFDGARNRFR